MKCIGYGQYEGKCENKAGTIHSDYWCQRCDDIRLKKITENMENILIEMEEKE